MKTFVRTAAMAGALALMATGASAAILSQSQKFRDGTIPGDPIDFANDAALVAAGYVFTPGPTGDNAAGSGGKHPTARTQNDLGGGTLADGINDGAIYVDGGGGNETVAYNFVGTIANGETYNFEVVLFQASSSFADADIELLVNGTTVVASQQFRGAPNGTTAVNGFFNSGAGPTPPPGVNNAERISTLTYTGTALTAGQTLGFRAREVRVTNSADLGIDNWNLTVGVVPEPATLALGALGLCGLAIYRRR